MSYRLNKATEQAEDNLTQFRSYRAFPSNIRGEIYAALSDKFRIDIQSSVLVSWLPEGGKNLVISLIDQHGNLCNFDLDPDYPENDSEDREPIDSIEQLTEYQNRKPWDELILAIELYRRGSL